MEDRERGASAGISPTLVGAERPDMEDREQYVWDPPLLCKCKIRRARLAELTGDIERAHGLYCEISRETQKECKSKTMGGGEQQMLLHMARTATMMGDLESAEAWLGKAMQSLPAGKLDCETCSVLDLRCAFQMLIVRVRKAALVRALSNFDGGGTEAKRADAEPGVGVKLSSLEGDFKRGMVELHGPSCNSGQCSASTEAYGVAEETPTVRVACECFQIHLTSCAVPRPRRPRLGGTDSILDPAAQALDDPRLSSVALRPDKRTAGARLTLQIE